MEIQMSRKMFAISELFLCQEGADASQMTCRIRCQICQSHQSSSPGTVGKDLGAVDGQRWQLQR